MIRNDNIVDTIKPRLPPFWPWRRCSMTELSPGGPPTRRDNIFRGFFGVVRATTPPKVAAPPYLDLVVPIQKWRKSSQAGEPVNGRCVGVRGLSSSSQAGLLAEIDRLGTNMLTVEAGRSFTGEDA